MTIATRLRSAPSPKPSTGRRVNCHCCATPFATAKPQDPERVEGQGTCEACRKDVAAEWAEKNKVTFITAITRYTRFA